MSLWLYVHWDMMKFSITNIPVIDKKRLQIGIILLQYIQTHHIGPDRKHIQRLAK